MATIVITSLTRCAGQNHYTVTGTIDGQPGTINFLRQDLSLDPGEFKEAFFSRIRSALKEANANTFAEAKTALEGKTFKV